ncbi:immunoglobulin-like domain-containing protein [Bacteroides faecichinchillae]|uniref:immunoglobulin-like domain-containing protein n=1 Tax=Bacteroides faecichinchillae TaxID=871325 RepID=UPI000468D5FE
MANLKLLINFGVINNSFILLPAVGESGSTISWNLNKSEYINNQGIVHHQDAGSDDKKVILTATLQKGRVLLKKNFTATIMRIYK